MIKFFTILTTIVGTLMSIGYYPQAYNIWKNKSAKNVSILTFAIFALGTIIWTIYGILVKDMTVIITFSIGVIGSWLVLILTLIYRNK